MNRQIRRVEEKKERKVEKEKAKAKAARQARRRERAAQRQRSATASSGGKTAGGDASKGGSGKGGSGPRRSNPGRFSGALMAATVFFIALQAVTPTDGTLASQAVSASFYLLFAYFAVLWMMRRDSPRPLAIAIGSAAVMGVATLASQWLQPSLEVAPIMLALILPLAVAGAFLGRLVWQRAP